MTEREADILTAMLPGGWKRPMDFGGHDGSHHAITAQRMAAKGWVEKHRMKGIGGGRGHWLYHISDKGRQALHNHNFIRLPA